MIAHYDITDIEDYSDRGQSMATLRAGQMIANALIDVANALYRLGNGDPATQMSSMGAMEALGKAILDASENLAGNIDPCVLEEESQS